MNRKKENAAMQYLLVGFTVWVITFLSFAIRTGSNRKREQRTAAQSIRIGTSCPDIG
ncbi:MAG: hypothetical protein ACLRX4_07365 [Oscillospiraceae bacterium]